MSSLDEPLSRQTVFWKNIFVFVGDSVIEESLPPHFFWAIMKSLKRWLQEASLTIYIHLWICYCFAIIVALWFLLVPNCSYRPLIIWSEVYWSLVVAFDPEHFFRDPMDSYWTMEGCVWFIQECILSMQRPDVSTLSACGLSMQGCVGSLQGCVWSMQGCVWSMQGCVWSLPDTVWSVKLCFDSASQRLVLSGHVHAGG